jgi:transcriptional regulator with XRE-family HTH domain
VEHRHVPESIHHPRYQTLRSAMVAARKEAGLTQIQMAGLLEVGQSYVSKIERGESYIDVMTYVDWYTACGMPPGAVLDALLDKASLSKKRAKP